MRFMPFEDWQNTVNPNHPSAGPEFRLRKLPGLPHLDTFLNAKFDHSTTGFLLTNGHANVACSACHINNNYSLQIAPTDCGKIPVATSPPCSRPTLHHILKRVLHRHFELHELPQHGRVDNLDF